MCSARLGSLTSPSRFASLGSSREGTPDLSVAFVGHRLCGNDLDATSGGETSTLKSSTCWLKKVTESWKVLNGRKAGRTDQRRKKVSPERVC